MWKGSVLVAALAVALTAIAGVAVAAVGSSSDTALAIDDTAVTLPATTNDGAGEEASTTTTSIAATEDDDDEREDDRRDDSAMSDTAATSDDDDDESDDSGSMSATATTTTMGDLDDDYDDDYSDDDYSDDDYGDDYSDDDDYVMIADGVYPIDASPYGSVTVEVRDGMLYLTSIDIDSVWMLYDREEKSDEVELKFYWGESELKIKVEVDDGQLKKMVEFDMKDDYDDDYSDDDDYVMIADGFYPIDASPYGSITVEVRDGMLYLSSIDIDSVWLLYDREEKSDEVELKFYWGESELKIKVEVDDGQLKKLVEFDMK